MTGALYTRMSSSSRTGLSVSSSSSKPREACSRMPFGQRSRPRSIAAKHTARRLGTEVDFRVSNSFSNFEEAIS